MVNLSSTVCAFYGHLFGSCLIASRHKCIVHFCLLSTCFHSQSAETSGKREERANVRKIQTQGGKRKQRRNPEFREREVEVANYIEISPFLRRAEQSHTSLMPPSSNIQLPLPFPSKVCPWQLLN